MKWRIPLSDLDFGPEEEAAVQAVIRGGWLTMGEITQAFESEFAEYNRVEHAIAVSSCTAALHLACIALGIGPGDEVILPALTFVAAANAVRYTGAMPVFADIESISNLNISPPAIEARINERTKAIIVMHYAGYSCDMPRIMQLAEEHNLHVIEDAAHAVGSSLEERMLGAWGDIGCYSFFSNKNLVTGEGGMLVSNDPAYAARIKRLRSHGMTSLTWDRHQGHAWSYDVLDLGYNYRLDEIRSALGRVQLGKLEGHNEQRRALVRHYRELLAELAPDVIVPFEAHPGVSAAHIMPIMLPEAVDRRLFIERLKNEQIQTSIHYPPIYKFQSYADINEDYARTLANTEAAAEREVTLPLYAHMQPAQIELVVKSIRQALAMAK